MLTDRSGVRLVLMCGRTVPKPAPPAVADALTSVEVTNDVDGPDGFQLGFTLDKSASGEHPIAREVGLQPMSRVVLGVLLKGAPQVLIDGLVTRHDTRAARAAGRSTLTVTGRDLTQALDLEERTARYPNQPDWAIVTQVVGRYARYGLLPRATPTTDVPLELFRVPRQQETDLAFVRRLAERNGYVFYLEPVTFGVTEAYWGPELRAGPPQPALTVDMGEASNVARLDVSYDAAAPVGVVGSVFEPITKRALPLPALPALRLPPLAAQPAPALRRRLLRTGPQSPTRAAVSAVAEVSTATEAVTATGTADGPRYGHVLRARRIVGVRGAGLGNDGFYYVRRVTHRIADGAYTQGFALSREGTGALLPVVPP